MHIAVDLDDVVMDFWVGVCNSINLEYGLKIDPALTTDWERNEVKHLDIFGEGRTWWDWLRDRDWVWATFQPVPGAIGGIQRLRQDGHYVEALTKKPDWAEWTVWKWLGLWRPPFNQVTIVPSGSPKTEATKASLLIDDSPDNIMLWKESGRRILIFNQPWNTDLEGPRVYTWEGVLDAVKELNELEGWSHGLQRAG